MNHTKIISEKTIFKAEKAFEVKEETLLLPNKEKKIQYVAHRVPCVAVFPLTKNYELYLISQYRYLFNKTIIESVSGRMDNGETSLLAAKRELKEEAGIIANQWEELSRVELASSFFQAKMYLFLAKDLEIGKQQLEDDETIEVIKLSLDEAVKKVYSGEINNSTTMIGIMILDQLRREKKL